MGAAAPVQRHELVGSLLGAAGAVSYGVTVVFGRILARDGLGPATSLGIRFAIAGGALLLVLVARRSALLPAPGERLRIFLLGAVGYTGQATLFFLGLERGTAAAVALVFYAYPALVMVAEIALGWERPQRAVLVALALSTAGAVLVVTTGDRLALSATGLIFTLGAASGFGLYLLTNSRVVSRSEPLVQASWLALGAAASSLAHGAATSDLVAPGRQWVVLTLYGLATASAFTFMLAALARLGPSRTAVILTLEAFSAVVLGAVFLGETLALSQLAGGLAILAATVTIARSRRQSAPPPADSPMPPAGSPVPPASSASSDSLGR